MKKYEEWGTEEDEPFEWAKYYFLDGMIKTLKGNPAEALGAFEKAIHLRSASISGSSQTLGYQCSVACIRLLKGEVEEGLKTHVAVHGTCCELFGETSQMSLASAYCVGATYYELGRLEEAE